jgi:hypothetical protein
MLKAIALVALALALEGGFILNSVVAPAPAHATPEASLSRAVASVAR